VAQVREIHDARQSWCTTQETAKKLRQKKIRGIQKESQKVYLEEVFKKPPEKIAIFLYFK